MLVMVIYILFVTLMRMEEVLKLMVFKLISHTLKTLIQALLAPWTFPPHPEFIVFINKFFITKTRPSKMDIYHRFCVIVSLIQKQTNRIWELHYTLKITKP